MCTSNTIFYKALDNCHEVELSRTRVRNYKDGKFMEEYVQLTLELPSREDIGFERALKRIEPRRGETPREFLDLQSVEARVNETGQEAWFVERDTGPDDEPPTWATPDDGERLGVYLD